MALISDEVDPWLLTILAILLPWLYRVVKRLRTTSAPGTAPQAATPGPTPPPRTRLDRPLTALLALHTLATLYTLLYARPANVFTSLGLPLSAPQAHIRSLLVRKVAAERGMSIAGNETQVLSPALDRLLARLASFEVRTVLVRFGQWTVQTCTYCSTVTDYALHSLPGLLFSYSLRGMLLGALTIRGSAHERRRGPAIAVLVFSALAEVYWAYTVSVSIPRQGAKESVTMWHDMLFLARHALFIILPLAVHLSARQTSPEVAAAAFAPAAAQRLDTALARTHLLRYTAAATRRAPPLAARAREFWEDERQVGSAIRGDEGVRTAAAAANLGIEEGETREEGGVRNWVSSLGVSSVGAPTANGDGGMGQKEGLLRSVVRIAVRDLKTMYKPPDAP